MWPPSRSVAGCSIELAEARTSRIRLLSANLFTRFVDADDFARVVDEEQPDIVVAVEMDPRAGRVLQERYDHRLLMPDPGFHGWGIASRHPAEFWTEPAWRGGRAEVEVGSRRLNLAAVHITDPIFGNWRVNRRVRAQQVAALLDWGDSTRPEDPLVAAGDFNASPAWDVYRRLASRWDDLVLSAAKDAGRRPQPTWGPRVRLLRIDHVFGRRLTGFDPRVVRVRGSDHSAVVIDLEIVGAGDD